MNNQMTSTEAARLLRVDRTTTRKAAAAGQVEGAQQEARPGTINPPWVAAWEAWSTWYMNRRRVGRPKEGSHMQTFAEVLIRESRWFPVVFARIAPNGAIETEAGLPRSVTLRELGEVMTPVELLDRLTPEQRDLTVSAKWGVQPGGLAIVRPHHPNHPYALLAFSASTEPLPGRGGEAWENWVGSQTPAEFWYLYLEEGCTTPEEAAERYVAEVPSMFGADADPPEDLASDLADYLRASLGL